MKSNLIDHANRELTLAGYPELTREYKRGNAEFDVNMEIRKDIMELVTMFAKQHHSGASAGYVTRVLTDLLQYKPISPLTDNPEEWNEVGEGFWQCKREPSCFSTDGGKTYYTLDTMNKKRFNLYRRMPQWLRTWIYENARSWIYPVQATKPHAQTEG